MPHWRRLEGGERITADGHVLLGQNMELVWLGSKG